MGAWLGGEDSNPQCEGQNLVCCRLHHPRTHDILYSFGSSGIVLPGQERLEVVGDRLGRKVGSDPGEVAGFDRD
jgi:hypothetical protein